MPFKSAQSPRLNRKRASVSNVQSTHSPSFPQAIEQSETDARPSAGSAYWRVMCLARTSRQVQAQSKSEVDWCRCSFRRQHLVQIIEDDSTMCLPCFPADASCCAGREVGHLEDQRLLQHENGESRKGRCVAIMRIGLNCAARRQLFSSIVRGFHLHPAVSNAIGSQVRGMPSAPVMKKSHPLHDDICARLDRATKEGNRAEKETM